MPIIRHQPHHQGPMFQQTNNPACGPRKLLTLVIAAMASFGLLAIPATSAGVVEAQGPADHDWVSIVNTYRAQSGLSPITENPSWSLGGQAHSCWMLLNGIAHDEAPGTAGYSVAGDDAGNSGNVAVSSDPTATARDQIDLWMSGPYHAIGILRSTLREAGYGGCSSPPNPSATPWKSGGTLDVIRGNDWGAPRPTVPVVFPGNGATTSLTRFVAETPDPRIDCGWNGQTVGLPLLALMPAGVSSATASLTGPTGPIPTCVLHASNTSGTASSILGGDNAVIVMPNAPLAAGTYTVSVNSNGGNANWSFNVDPNAPLLAEVPDLADAKLGSAVRFQAVSPFRFADSRMGRTIGRLPAGKQIRIAVAGKQGIPSDATAISANFTIAGPDGPGYFSAYDCAGSEPNVSTSNYQQWEDVPNQAIIPLNNGDMCLYSVHGAHLIIDVNGYMSPGAELEFVPVDPRRMYDSRGQQPLAPNEVRRIRVAGGSSPAPEGAAAVALNITAPSPRENGWIRAFPCDTNEPESSSLNPRFVTDRANSAIVPISPSGDICVRSSTTTDVIIDITGWFSEGDHLEFVPVQSLRIADTRSTHPDLHPHQSAQMIHPGEVLEIKVAGARGVTDFAKAATVNLVAAAATQPGWLRVVPCGLGSSVSNVNYPAGAPYANGTNVKLSSKGSICITSSATTHVVIDLTGVWV